MHAYLINGLDVNSEIEKLIATLDSKRMDFDIQKIADVKDLKQFLKISLPQKTTIVLKNFDTTTEEAQNSLLKQIEEPNNQLSFILTAKNLDNVLPTIRSRCQTIDVTKEVTILSKKLEEQAEQFLRSGTGGRLKITSTIKDRQEAIEFLEGLLVVGHRELLNQVINTQLLEEAQNALQAIKANGNLQLQLTSFVVKIN